MGDVRLDEDHLGVSLALLRDVCRTTIHRRGMRREPVLPWMALLLFLVLCFQPYD